jgi:NADH:ubiquinone oxidoreductase subunit F (NADH-binding)
MTASVDLPDASPSDRTDAGSATERRAAAESSRAGGLVGSGPATQTELTTHLNVHGTAPVFEPRDVVELATDASLTGRGGAGFPLWRKLEAVRGASGRAVVVANGAEGEPAGAKDRWLLAHRPHLVLDGLQLAATAVRAGDAYLYVNGRLPVEPLIAAVAARRRAGLDQCAVEVVSAPNAFIAGEESAVVNWLGGGAAVPRAKPPRIVERGLRARPTLVSNVETLAQLALIARRGAGWFRSTGTAEFPGTMLCTVSGAVRQPGIVETPHGALLSDVLQIAGGPSRPLQAVLIGGYHGTWLTAGEVASARLSRAGLAKVGGSPGAGVIVALPHGTCGLAEASRVTSYLAAESARQCGPCLNGLPRLAAQLKSLAFQGGEPGVLAELQRLAGIVTGRGACHHPDGSTRFVNGSLRVFADEVELHLRGQCSRTSDDVVLPTRAALDRRDSNRQG